MAATTILLKVTSINMFSIIMEISSIIRRLVGGNYYLVELLVGGERLTMLLDTGLTASAPPSITYRT